MMFERQIEERVTIAPIKMQARRWDDVDIDVYGAVTRKASHRVEIKFTRRSKNHGDIVMTIRLAPEQANALSQNITDKLDDPMLHKIKSNIREGWKRRTEIVLENEKQLKGEKHIKMTCSKYRFGTGYFYAYLFNDKEARELAEIIKISNIL